MFFVPPSLAGRGNTGGHQQLRLLSENGKRISAATPTRCLLYRAKPDERDALHLIGLVTW